MKKVVGIIFMCFILIISILGTTNVYAETDLQPLTRAMMGAEMIFDNTEKEYTKESLGALKEVYNRASDYLKNNDKTLETEQSKINELAEEIQNAIKSLKVVENDKTNESSEMENNTNVVLWGSVLIIATIGLLVTTKRLVK